MVFSTISQMSTKRNKKTKNKKKKKKKKRGEMRGGEKRETRKEKKNFIYINKTDPYPSQLLVNQIFHCVHSKSKNFKS